MLPSSELGLPRAVKDMETNGLKMPDEFTELSYEDGEMSGSGTKKWNSEDT